MNLQAIQRLTKFHKWFPALRYTLWIALFLLNLNLQAITPPTEALKGRLPVPGSTQTSETLFLNQSGVLLENDQITLNWQNDGNLVLYFYGKYVIWSTNTQGKGSVLAFQNSDGKLVIKNSNGTIIWSSGGSGGNLLKLQTDRNLVMLNASNQKIWESGSTITYLSEEGRHRIGSNGDAAQDFAIPANTSYKYIYLRTEGGDGGKRQVKETWGATRFTVNGGEGATIEGAFALGTGTNEIPPGSTLRFIVGRHGAERNAQTTAGCPGGGGTAVLFKKPNSADWHLLMVAGGGGGAYSDCCSVKREGHPAVTGANGDPGGQSGGAGGVDGSYGGDGPGMGYSGTGGGGAYEGELYTGGQFFYISGGPGWDSARTRNNNGSYSWDLSQLPQGGVGGRQNTTTQFGDTQGAWGFGGGGSGNTAGGGGGGYSGGGGGTDYYPGGGGGSYINTGFASNISKTKNGTTDNPEDGFVDYQLFNSLSDIYNIIHLTKDQGKCVDVNGGGANSGTNVQLWRCNNGAAQNWVIEALMVKYAKDRSKCLELSGSTAKNGANIDIWGCNVGSNAQKWIYDGVNKAIRSKVNMDYCIDLVNGSTADGTNIQLYQCKDVAAQHWTVSKAANPVVSDNYNHIKIAAATDKCVDVQAANTANGTNIMVYHCHNAESQYWHFDGNAIRFNKDRNKCLDLENSNASNGANIQLYDCNGTNAQKWIYDAVAQSFRSWINPDKCIDIDHSNFNDGTNIQVWDCNGTSAQQFIID